MPHITSLLLCIATMQKCKDYTVQHWSRAFGGTFAVHLVGGGYLHLLSTNCSQDNCIYICICVCIWICNQIVFVILFEFVFAFVFVLIIHQFLAEIVEYASTCMCACHDGATFETGHYTIFMLCIGGRGRGEGNVRRYYYHYHYPIIITLSYYVIIQCWCGARGREGQCPRVERRLHRRW